MHIFIEIDKNSFTFLSEKLKLMTYFITNGICKLGTYGSNPNILMVCEDHKREISQEGIK